MPATRPVTLTLNVQEPAAAIVPPASATLCEPAAAVTVPLPQVPVSPLGVETVSPAGKESVKATPANASEVFGLVIVKLSEVEPASPMDVARNALEMLGGVATVNVAEAVFPVPPFVEETFPVVFV